MARAPTGSAAGWPVSGWGAATRCCSCSATRWSCGTACSRVMKLGAVIVPTDDRGGRRRPRRPGRPQRSPGRRDDPRPDGQVRRPRGRPRADQRGCRPTGGPTCATRMPCDVEPLPHPGTAPGDPLLLYFTSGTTARPKLVEHTQVSYPVGHLSTAYWLGLQPGDRAPQPLEPRLGQARVVAASSRRGSPSRRSSCCPTPRFDAGPAARRAARPRGHQLLRAADGVADADQRRPVRRARLAARGGRCRRAAQPRGHRAGPPRVGARPARRLRPDRDDRRRRQHPRVTAQARLDGPAAARRARGARRPADRRARRRPGRGRALPRPRPRTRCRS